MKHFSPHEITIKQINYKITDQRKELNFFRNRFGCVLLDYLLQLSDELFLQLKLENFEVNNTLTKKTISTIQVGVVASLNKKTLKNKYVHITPFPTGSLLDGIPFEVHILTFETLHNQAFSTPNIKSFLSP